MTCILVHGHAVLDCVLQVDNFPNSDSKTQTRHCNFVCGGPAVNAAIAITRLGGNALLATRLGNDFAAQIICNELQSHNIDPTFVHTLPTGKTSFSSVLVNRQGERQIVNYPGMLATDTNWLQAPRADALLSDNRWLPGMKKALQIARDQDIPAVVDGENSHSLEDLTMATHVAFSRQGICYLTGESDLLQALHKAKKRLPGWVCVTDGAKGVYIIRGNTTQNIPAFSVRSVDTLAAGDVWHGAFTLQLARGKNEEQAIEFANAVAALKCTVRDKKHWATTAQVKHFLQEKT